MAALAWVCPLTSGQEIKVEPHGAPPHSLFYSGQYAFSKLHCSQKTCETREFGAENRMEKELESLANIDTLTYICPYKI